MKFNGIRRRWGRPWLSRTENVLDGGRVLGLSPTYRPAHWVCGGKTPARPLQRTAEVPLSPVRSEHPSTVTLTLLPERLYVHMQVFVLHSCLRACVLNMRDALIKFAASSSSPVMLTRFFTHSSDNNKADFMKL